jgi:hypothetical protein
MEPEQPTTDQNSKKPLAVEMDSEKDHFLQDLVFQTNVFPTNDTPITLLVGGVFVSGIMIAGDEYFQLIAGLTSSPGKEFYEHVLRFGAGYTEDREAKKVNEEPVYIHLKECSYSSGFGLMKLSNVWRGRLSAVDGYFMGTLRDGDK